MTLARIVVREDNRLETAAESIDLAQHRWHWTLDECNPLRVSIRAYAGAVGRGETTIRDIVNGYAEWAARGAPRREFSDYHARAKLRGETLAATGAVAKAKGISIESARRHHIKEVRQVRAVAQKKVEESLGTTSVQEEVQQIATFRENVRQSAKKHAEDKKARHTVRYMEAEGKIARAMQYLRSTPERHRGCRVHPRGAGTHV